MKNITSVILSLLLFVSCELFEDSTDQKNSNIEYPTIIYPLSETEICKLQLELYSLLNSEYLAALDEYGFIRSNWKINRGSSSISDENIAISQAKATINTFSQFTNITDTSILIVKEATNQSGTPFFSDWIISFENQSYDNIEVLSTEIMIIITDNIIQIIGHHYPDIVIPDHDLISLEDAEESVIGLELTYYGYADIDTFVVDENSIHVDNASEETTMKILPFEVDENIELRVCWRIPIFMGSIYPDFYIFIDTVSGDMITYKTLFIC